MVSSASGGPSNFCERWLGAENRKALRDGTICWLTDIAVTSLRAQSTNFDKPLLMLLTRPVGGGKSTVALAVADRFREVGKAVAVIDLTWFIAWHGSVIGSMRRMSGTRLDRERLRLPTCFLRAVRTSWLLKAGFLAKTPATICVSTCVR